MFPCHAREASTAFRESATWGSDVELEAIESEQTSLTLSLPLSPEQNSLNSRTITYIFPSPEARNTISFRLDDVLFTAASDAEDFQSPTPPPPSGLRSGKPADRFFPTDDSADRWT